MKYCLKTQILLIKLMSNSGLCFYIKEFLISITTQFIEIISTEFRIDPKSKIWLSNETHTIALTPSFGELIFNSLIFNYFIPLFVILIKIEIHRKKTFHIVHIFSSRIFKYVPVHVLLNFKIRQLYLGHPVS